MTKKVPKNELKRLKGFDHVTDDVTKKLSGRTFAFPQIFSAV